MLGNLLGNFFGGGEGGDAGARNTADWNRGLGFGRQLLSWNARRKAADDYNQQVLNDFYLRRDKYYSDWNAEKVNWTSKNIDRKKQVDQAWQSYVEQKSFNTLKQWIAVKDASIKTQQAYASMLANDVGGEGAKGKRGGKFVNRRKAVLSFAANEIGTAGKVIADKDYNRLTNDSRFNAMLNAQAKISQAAQLSTPVPKIPPRTGAFKSKPGIGELLLGFAGEHLKANQLYDKLKPPETYEPDRPTQPESEWNTDPNWGYGQPPVQPEPNPSFVEPEWLADLGGRAGAKKRMENRNQLGFDQQNVFLS